MSSLLSRRPVRVAVGMIAPALLLLWWQAQASSGGSRAIAFAPLSSVAATSLELISNGSLVAGAVATVSTSLAGLLIGGTAGLAFGLLMALSRPVERLLGPFIQGVRQVPIVGWLPLIGLWVGTGVKSELIVVSLSAFFPTLLNAHAGLADVERRYIEVGHLYRFDAVQRFRHILLPAAMPMILTGATQGLAFAWIAAVGSEILLGTGSGLGVVLQTAQVQQRMDVILVTIIVTAALGFLINSVFLALRRHLLRWQAAPL